MTIQAIQAALYNLIVASGPYLGSEVSTCSYDVLENASASAITFFPGRNSVIEDVTFGQNNVNYIVWSIEGSIWIKSTGNVEDTLGRAWKAHDDLFATTDKDNQLGGAAKHAHLHTFSFNPEAAFDAAGAVWQRINWTMEVEELNR